MVVPVTSRAGGSLRTSAAPHRDASGAETYNTPLCFRLCVVPTANLPEHLDAYAHRLSCKCVLLSADDRSLGTFSGFIATYRNQHKLRSP
jgi:hypothetical protein